MKNLDRRNKYFFGLGTIGRDMFYAFEANALLYFLSNILSLPLHVFAAVSLVLSVLRIADALNDPITGLVIDNIHTKWGKFKPAILVGGVVGCVNGLMLTRLHLPHPFVSTLGMKNVLWGLALVVTGNQMINNFPESVQWLGKTTISGFPVSFIVVIVLYIVMHIFLSKTALGRSIYCAGGNIEASRLSGINTANVLTFCYTVSGIMAALAGIVSVGRSGICNGANATQPYDTDAIAACIIGGASFTGGKGTMFGTMIGCLIISVLRNGFSLLSIDSAVQNIVLGLVIILAVLMDVVRAQMEAKRRRLAAAK